jgi:hypothetical protein
MTPSRNWPSDICGRSEAIKKEREDFTQRRQGAKQRERKEERLLSGFEVTLPKKEVHAKTPRSKEEQSAKKKRRRV